MLFQLITQEKKFLKLEFVTNFDYIKINSLFSNLESLNIFQLIHKKKILKKLECQRWILIFIYTIILISLNLVIFL